MNIATLEDLKIVGTNIALQIKNHINMQDSFIVALNGELGAGKTALVKTILTAFGVIGTIKSPTYTLLEPYYSMGYNLYHFDLYRLSNERDWYVLGFDEYLTQGISFIEWAVNVPYLNDICDWHIGIHSHIDDSREINITALTDKGKQCQKHLMQAGVNI